MALNIIVGRPGSGKSYEAVAFHVIPAIKEGRRVVTNLPLMMDHLIAVFGEEVRDLVEVRQDGFSREHGAIKAFSDPEHFTLEEWRNEQGQGPLFVIDECHFQYPRAGRNKKASDDLINCLEYFSMHRHYGHDILFMTQSLGKVHKDLRDMIEIQFLVSKHAAAGSDKTYTRKVLDGAGARATCLSESVRRYDKTFFPFYKSHTQTEGSVQEAKASDIVPLWKRWWLWLAVILIFIGVPMSVKSLFNMLGNDEPAPVSVPVEQAAASPAPSDPEVKAAAPVMPTTPAKSVQEAPFSKFDITITGWADTSYKDNTGKFHAQFEYYLEAKGNNAYSFPMKLSDLMMAGYQVYSLGPCLLRLVYDEREHFLYCQGNKPQQESSATMALAALPLN